MAFNDFRKKEQESVPASQPAGSGVGALTAFIDQGSEFAGKLSFKDTVRIDGRFEGEISSENTLIVGESGVVHADVRSQVVIVSGEIHGDIEAQQQIILHKTATVFGSLRTAKLSIEDGAQLNGQIEMGQAAAAKLRANAKGQGSSKPAEA
jgi:cytoskeletal protein CcmA (bactofilin family)